AIAAGIKSTNSDVAVKLYNTAKADKNDVITEVYKAKAILVGSSTINKGILHSVAGMLEQIKGLGFKNKKAAAFGSYGWSGESVQIITEELKKAGFEVIDSGVKALWNPDKESLDKCFDLGKQFGEALK
ncbi:MAG: beta-lactamase domain protein, partial [Clostridia bacterium]|nr:beta-lactamase domain protein [Clostridia bacterium]